MTLGRGLRLAFRQKSNLRTFSESPAIVTMDQPLFQLDREDNFNRWSIYWQTSEKDPLWLFQARCSLARR